MKKLPAGTATFGRIRGVTHLTVAQAPHPLQTLEWPITERAQRAQKRQCATRQAAGSGATASRCGAIYAVRRRPVAASRTALKNSVRCSESRCGSSEQSRPGTGRSESRRPLRRGGCGHRAPVGARPRQERGQPLQRSQRRNRLAVFDLRDVGARHLHPSRQLALAQVARPAQFPHLPATCNPASAKRAQAGWSPAVEPRKPAPRYRGACGIFCKGSCWSYTASTCSTHTAPLRVFPR